MAFFGTSTLRCSNSAFSWLHVIFSMAAVERKSPAGSISSSSLSSYASAACRGLFSAITGLPSASAWGVGREGGEGL